MKIDLNIRELEIFCKVVEFKSFSKAAESVHLAQASVSERISSLEDKIGIRLLDRLGRKVIPTAAGELLLKHATYLLEVTENARIEMESFLGLQQGEINIGGSTIPGEYILPELLSQFFKTHPRLAVNLSISDSRIIEKRVLAGRYEIGVVGSSSEHPNLLCQKLWEDELVLAVNKGHPWAKRKSVSIKMLRNATFIMREKGSGTLKMINSFFRENSEYDPMLFQVCARLGSSTAVKEGIKAGLGVSILSKRAVETEIKSGLIKIVKISGLPMLRNFYLIQNNRRVTSPPAQAMIDFLLSTVTQQA